MIAADALAFALKHWKAILGGAVILALSIALAIAQANTRHWHKRYDQEAALHALDIATWKGAADKARADDLAHAAAVKQRDDAIAQETQNALEARLADAQRLAADYARRMRIAAPADTGGQRDARPGAAADPAGTVAATGSDAFVSITDADLGICTQAVIVAQGWQSWWSRVSVEPR